MFSVLKEDDLDGEPRGDSGEKEPVIWVRESRELPWILWGEIWKILLEKERMKRWLWEIPDSDLPTP